MPAANLTTTSGHEGVIQRYLRKAFMDLQMEVFRSPLVNSPLAIQGSIPRNMGQSVQFRFYEHFTPDGVLFSEGSEPAASEVLQATTREAPIEELSRYVSLGNLLVDTDLINIVSKARDLLRDVAKRDAHVLATIRMVQGAAISAFGTTFNNIPFKTTFAGQVDQFGDLVETSRHTMRDWKRARSLLSNNVNPVPTMDGMYHAIISPAISDELREDDKDFREIVKRDGGMRDTVFGQARMVDFEGIRWVIQDDGYRTALPIAGGALNTRLANGAVHVGHLLGAKSFGQVALGGKKPTQPKFKVQDISITGVEMTAGYRIPHQNIVVRDDFGVNVAGTSRFSAGIDDI